LESVRVWGIILAMIERLKAFTQRRAHPATWLIWLLPVFAWAPLTYPGYFELHSGFLPIFNLADLARHLTDLSWAPAIGQPYDLLRGERALPYLLGMIPRGLGASSMTAVKWVFGASMMAGALGMYTWARRRLGPWPGLLAAMVYVFWPLGLTTVYVRGALAEAVLLGLMPWALWAADRARETGGVGPASALGLALAAAVWTQAGLAIWFAVLVGGYLVGARPRGASAAESEAGPPDGDNRVGVSPPGAEAAGRRGGSPLKRAGLARWGWFGGLALAALGLAPVALRRGLGGTSWVTFLDHLVYPHQLLLASGGNGGGMAPSIAGPNDTLTFQLGLVACGLAAFSVLARTGTKEDVKRETKNVKRETKNEKRNTQYAVRNTQHFAFLVVAALAFLSTTLAAPFWRGLPFLARTLTYPWQLLLLTGPWLAWLAGLGGRALVELLPVERRPAAAIPLIASLLTLALLGVYFDPAAGSVQLLNPPPITAPTTDAPAAVFGEDEIALLEAVTLGKPGPGGRVTVMARWQALRPLERDYTVFFHVETPDGAVWGQRDTMPLDGQLPTSIWRPGQVVVDQYVVTLKPDAPIADDYRYLLGLYTWQDGVRLAVDGDDKVVLTP